MSDSSPPVNLDNPVDVLNAAAEHLDRVGLHKDCFWDLTESDSSSPTMANSIRKAPCCVLGALRTVLGAFAKGGTRYSVHYSPGHSEEPWWDATPAYKALEAEAGQYPALINDKPETTKDDMVNLLRRAAVRAASMETK